MYSSSASSHDTCLCHARCSPPTALVVQAAQQAERAAQQQLAKLQAEAAAKLSVAEAVKAKLAAKVVSLERAAVQQQLQVR